MSDEGWKQAAEALDMSVKEFKKKMGGRMTGLFDLTDEQLADFRNMPVSSGLNLIQTHRNLPIKSQMVSDKWQRYWNNKLLIQLLLIMLLFVLTFKIY